MSAVPTLPEPQLRPLLDSYRRAVAARGLATLLGAGILLLAVVLAGWEAEVRPLVFLDNLGNAGSYVDRLATLDTGARVWTDPVYWFWGLRRWSLLLGQTVLIAYAATFAGAALGLAGGVLASRPTSPSPVLRFASIRVLEFARTVPDIVFALVFVVAFGLGALPGVLAITLHSTGTLGKLFAEVIETTAPGPVEGIAANGGGWLSRVQFGVLPQVASNLASYTLLRFEVNLRSATVIGFVGAGGIGSELLTAIRKFYYGDVSAMLLMILACVVLVDMVSGVIRQRLLRSGPA